MNPERQWNHLEASPRLECGDCHREIPETVAEHPEGEEYIGHYCEPTCLAEWARPTSSR